MKTRKLGKSGPTVGAIGLGCMGMSAFYGPGDDIESTASRKLQEKTSKDRLASGGDERAPAEYQKQVDSYFKALATRKRP